MDNENNIKKCNKCKITKNIEYFSLCLKTKKYKNTCKQCNAEKARIWRQNNKEKVKISKNKHAIKHKQKISEAQKKRNDKWYETNKYKVSMYRHTLNNRYLRYVSNCKTKERKFLLSKEEFFKITSQECYYCGGFNVSENILIKKINLDYCGIDRIDNSIDYIIENCVPCCNICNRMKLELSKEDFFTHIKKIMEKIK